MRLANSHIACRKGKLAYGDTVSSALPAQRPLAALMIRLAAALTLSVMLVLVKLASESGIHLAEILFWRQLPTIFMIGGWFWITRQLHRLSTQQYGLHGKRAVYGLTGMFLNFGAITLLPLAEATTLNFTTAIWAVILSALLLREPIGIYRWSAVLLGFVGVIIITQPGQSPIPLFGACVALGAAFMIALISIQIRDLNRTEEPLTIVFYFSAFTVPVLGLVLPFVATEHNAYQWSLLGGLALIGLLGQFLLTASLRYGTVASVIVMDYSALIWAILFGWVVFSDLPPATTWIGAPVIVLAGIVIAWREHVVARANVTDTAPPA